jgi:hypothetical protein
MLEDSYMQERVDQKGLVDNWQMYPIHTFLQYWMILDFHVPSSHYLTMGTILSFCEDWLSINRIEIVSQS